MTSSRPPRFPRVVLDVPLALADDVAFELFDLGADGVEQRDQSTLDGARAEGFALLLASFPSESRADEACVAIDPAWKPRRDDVVGDAWRDGWKEHFRPFHLTPSILVRPPWTPVAEVDGQHVLVMDPGRAFGTGLHATTRLVARCIEQHALRLVGETMLDVGCGSGVLALCALSHGAASVRAIDNDPQAVSSTLENVERNGFASRVHADTVPVEDLDITYPFVVANIEARVLIPMARALVRRVAPDGRLVLSGILQQQVQEVLDAYRSLHFVEKLEERGWVALVLRADP